MTPRVYQFLTLATLSLTILLIIVGGATRVYDAGMACPDWPHCYGLWWPWPESRVMAAGHLQGYVVNGQHYVWWQVLLEWGHRGLAAVVGFGLLGLLVGSLWQSKKINTPLLLAAALLAMQIKLGAITVWFSNIHWSVVLHLGNAMLFTMALSWLWWRQRVPAPAKRATAPKILWALAIAAPVVVWVTMLIGAAVSSSHSGGVCGGLFSCAGVWMPSPKVDVGQHIHMQHRLFALITFALSVALVVVAKRSQLQPVRQVALQLHLMILGQVVLGILTLYSFANYPELYYPLSIAHLGWGTLTLLAALAVPFTLAAIPATPPAKSARNK